MKLYLVQHGESISKDINPDRPLTDKGREDSKKVAEFLKSAGIIIDVIWHSSKSRSKETAQIFSEVLQPKNVIEQTEGLAPNDPVEKIFDDTMSIKKDIMIVGHLPFLQKLVSLALLGSENHEIIQFKMAGVICLEEEENEWKLIFKINPELIMK